MLCNSIGKRAIGGNSREAGTFECHGVAIVNGAQTVGTITELSHSAADQLATARVPIRLISLEGCPPDFANEVTRATNTQNRVDSRNFVALDPEQGRIRAELLVDGIEYEYRQGEGEPVGEKRFGLVDATVALACSSGTVDLSVQAKREISKLWEDLSRPPYKLMFNSGTSSLKLWNYVQVLRVIDGHLDFSRHIENDPKLKSIVINGNRLIAFVVFRNFVCPDIGTAQFDIGDRRLEIESICDESIERVQKILEADYSDSYLAHLFKNLNKCRDVVLRIGAIVPDYAAIEARKKIALRWANEFEQDMPDIPF